MIAVITVLSVSWALSGFLYARMAWNHGAPENPSWRRGRTALVAMGAASVALAMLSLSGSVHPHAVGSAVLVIGLAVGAAGVITGQFRMRRQIRSRSPR